MPGEQAVFPALEGAMSDQRQWKEGVELVLDNRQIFLLFFASSVILSLVFALGVVVGKRITPGEQTAPATDPLAVLDQVGGAQPPEDELSFHEQLATAKAPPADPVKRAADDTAASNRGDRDAMKERSTQEKRQPAASAAAVARRKAAAADRSAKRPLARAAEAEANKAKAKAQAAAEASAAGQFSLQLSSFQDRSEAEAFMQKLRDTGMKPFLVPSKIPGRGVWFRVRLGAFESWDEAVAAKQSFERKRDIIAYVARN
jgi:cell division septation protein DedD